GHIRQFLAQHGADFRVIAPSEIMPNIMATFEGGKPGRHLALNGHIDVFPVGDGAGWTHDPWGAELAAAKLRGELLRVAGRLLQTAPDCLAVTGDRVVVCDAPGGPSLDLAAIA